MNDEGDDQQTGGELGSSVGGGEESGGRLRSNPSSEVGLQRFRGDGEDGGGLVVEKTPDVGRLRRTAEKREGSSKSASNVSSREEGSDVKWCFVSNSQQGKRLKDEIRPPEDTW